MIDCDEFKIVTTVTPIGSILVLAKILNTNEADLQKMIARKSSFHRTFKNNKNREVSSISQPLKHILQILNHYFFTKTIFPSYLLGGIKGRSYIDNAKAHSKKRILTNDDIRRFYPSITQEMVKNTFQLFFNLPPNVADYIAELCCLNGSLATGSPISCNIANLILFDVEPILVKELRVKNYTYTRFVDDITISSTKFLTKKDLTYIKTNVYAMLTKKNLRAHKQKSQIVSKANKMTVHKIIVNHANIHPSSKSINDIKLQLYNFSKACEVEDPNISNIIAEYRKLHGKINSLKSIGLSHTKSVLLKKNITDSLRLINLKVLTKYIRNIRHIKVKREYNSFVQKLNVLMKISPEIKKIILMEQKNNKL